MRVAIEPNFTNTISASIDNRSITSQCITLNEQKWFNKVVFPKKMQLLVTVNKSYSLMIERVQVIMRDRN